MACLPALLTNRMKILDTLEQLFRTAEGSRSPERLLELAMEVLARGLGLPVASLYLLQPDGSLSLHACLVPSDSHPSRSTFLPQPNGGISRVLRAGRAETNDATDPSEGMNAGDPADDLSPPPRVLVPLFSAKHTLGIALFWGTRKRPYASETPQALTLLGRWIGEAFEKACLLDDRRRAAGTGASAEDLSHALLDTIVFSPDFRIRAQDFLGRITSSALLGTIILDRKGTILYLNRGAESMTAYRAEEVVGKKRVKDLYANHADLARITRSLVQSGGIEGFETDLVRKDGTSTTAHVSASAIRGRNGRVVGSIVLLVDVTEKKRIEKELFRSEKLKALGEMAGGVAHDFNNILSTILGNVEMMLKLNDDPSLAARFKVIQEATLTGAETVKRIQDFARVRRERDFEPVDLNRIIMDSVELTRHRWKDGPQKRGVPLSLAYHLHKLSPALGNPYEIREVLMNLIFNAVDAMPAGGKLTIRTATEGSWAVVEVGDTGVGMTEEVHRHIFEPFFTTKGENNTGLGLSVSYGIITRHEGTIDVTSQPGKGTSFRLRFPMIEGVRERTRAPETSLRPDRIRILVIDDEKGVRDVLGEFLESAGHEVALAESGHEGVEMFRSNPCEVVITDLGMPRMNGWDVAREIRGIAPGAAFILTTGWGDILDPGKIRREGVDLVLPKPFQLDRLLDSIEEVLRRRQEIAKAPAPAPASPPAASIH